MESTSSQIAQGSSNGLTQVIQGSSNSAPLHFRWLKDLFDTSIPIPSHVWSQILSNASGSAITNHLRYLSLGSFLIHTNLLVSHPTQRMVDRDHVLQLRKSFEDSAIERIENPGVVIGLGEGWLRMKYTGPDNYMISMSSPHLDILSTTPNGPIGQIIRGGHRTAAIKDYAKRNPGRFENFWCYQVLVPGVCSIFFYCFFLCFFARLICIHLFLPSHQHSSSCATFKLLVHGQY